MPIVSRAGGMDVDFFRQGRRIFLYHFGWLNLHWAMPSELDPADFVDSDFQSSLKTGYATPAASPSSPPESPARPLSREEVESKVSETHVKLAELKRAQEELERERAALEDLRRRQIEFQTGREEMLQHLTRGAGLLEEAEFSNRQKAEQMARTIVDFRDSLGKVQALNEQNWSKEDYNLELTRALTTLENARLEWNAARIKFEVLEASPAPTAGAEPSRAEFFSDRSFGDLCRLGLALTWPIAVVGLAIFLLLMLRR